MSASYKYDVAVVGGGLSGLAAALRLAESGVRVAVLEQGDQEKYHCNTRFSGGAFHVCFHEVNEPEDAILQAIRQITGGTAQADFARAVARDTRTAVQWLKSKGIRFIKAGADAWRSNTLAPPLIAKPGLHWEGRGGDVMMRTLTAALKELKGELLLGVRATALRMDGGRCVGLDIEMDGQPAVVEAINVVICDGGFQANHDLLRQYITPAPEKLKQRNAKSGKGDGLRMARTVGAQTVGLNRFYGHLLSRDAMHNDALWPFPMVDHICQAAIVIDGDGKRFVDEGHGGVNMANSVARLADPLSTTAIYDAVIWDGPAREFILPANPNLEIAGATIIKASTLSELALQLNLPTGVLEKTVADYNAALAAGSTQQLTPVRTVTSHKAYPIIKPPFYALPLCAGITFTMGGLVIDKHARVLDESNRPIPGLYAAGCATGGLEGGELAGYVGGLSKSAVTGLLAADHIVAERRA